MTTEQISVSLAAAPAAALAVIRWRGGHRVAPLVPRTDNSRRETAESAMYQKILLAYDGSREGRAVLREGADLAERCDAAVYLLAVMTVQSGIAISESIVTSELTEEMREEVERTVREGLERLRGRGLSAEGRLAHGEPVEQISAVAREVGADLIVVGHKHRGALARWWKGSSVSRSLIDNAPCSVLIAIDHDGASER